MALGGKIFQGPSFLLFKFENHGSNDTDELYNLRGLCSVRF